MRAVMVRYRVKPDRAAENEELVRAVYDELHRTRPDGLHYATFVLEDGISFVHVSPTTSEDGDSRLSDLKTFQQSRAGIEERCDEAPVATGLREIGVYRAFGDAAIPDEFGGRVES